MEHHKECMCYDCQLTQRAAELIEKILPYVCPACGSRFAIKSTTTETCYDCFSKILRQRALHSISPEGNEGRLVDWIIEKTEIEEEV